jgi:Protein of unknown function (DUF3592)
MRDMADVVLEQRRAQHLMTNGRVGQATITQVTDTGVRLNDNPQVQIDLLVTMDGEPAYAASVTQVISRLAVAAFQPGATVPVRVDPRDPAQLIIA